ncbi:MAG TPA: hypothetical protein VEM41_08130, partial [Actinomycetota bacterium]|nr:hypothetical protein [Actinomycetota bacterium]
VLVGLVLVVGAAVWGGSHPPAVAPSHGSRLTFADYDANGVFYIRPSSWHATSTSPAADLVPEGALWAVAFEGPSGGADSVAVARFPGTDPGTPAARERAANAIAGAYDHLLLLPGIPRVRPVSATYPTYSHSVEVFLQDTASSSPGPKQWFLGDVVFTPHGRYVISCQSHTSEADVDARCGNVLQTFRETGFALPPGARSIHDVMAKVVEPWRSGDLAAAAPFATPDVLHELGALRPPTDRVSATCYSVGGGVTGFTCAYQRTGRTVTAFQVRVVDGQWKVAAVGDCAGTLANFKCYSLAKPG